MQQQIFEPGEAERKVHKLRYYLRESFRLETAGESVASKLALWHAHEIRDEIVERLTKRFWFAAVRRLENYPRDAQEDAVMLMVEMVVADLLNVGPSKTALAYEKRFNGIVDKRIRNALRTIRRQEKHSRFGRLLSLDDLLDQGEEGETRLDTLEDKGALAELNSVLTPAILSCFRRRLSPDQLQIIQMRVQYPDASVAELARLLQIPERTARSRLDKAKKLLVTIIQNGK